VHLEITASMIVLNEMLHQFMINMLFSPAVESNIIQVSSCYSPVKFGT